MTETRDRIIDASAELLRRQGYAATGVKQIVTAAQAPFGSLYHFFPGGKEELGAEAIRRSGALYELLIPAVFDPAPDLVSAVRAFFAGAAAHLRGDRLRGRLPDRHRRAGGVEHQRDDAPGLRGRVRELDRGRAAAVHRGGARRGHRAGARDRR